MPKINREKVRDIAKEEILKTLEEQDFLSQRSLEIKLEKTKIGNDHIYHTLTADVINELHENEKLRTRKYPPRGNFPKWVYKYSLRLDDIKKQIDNEYKNILREFNNKSSKMGFYAENIVEEALNKTGFTTVSRNTNYFNGDTYSRDDDLDFIAIKDNTVYGFEVKNTLSPPHFKKILRKQSVADYHDIQFVLVTRQSQRAGKKLFNNEGLHVDYEDYIWDPDFSSIGEKAKEKLGYPIKCLKSPHNKLINELGKVHRWHKKHFPKKGII